LAKLLTAFVLLAATTTQTAFAADDDSFIPEDVVAVADEAGVNKQDLAGAVFTVSEAFGVPVPPRQYAIHAGLIAPPYNPPPRVVPPMSARLACIARVESQNNPNATNRRSGAAGLFQFLWSTWYTTPQGRAGLSPYDPVAATAAAQWMVSQGRIREWVAVSAGYC